MYESLIVCLSITLKQGNMSKIDTLVKRTTQTRRKNNMKNKRMTPLKSPKQLNLPKRQSGKSKLGFKQLITNNGCSKKAADEVWKWYEN